MLRLWEAAPAAECALWLRACIREQGLAPTKPPPLLNGHPETDACYPSGKLRLWEAAPAAECALWLRTGIREQGFAPIKPSAPKKAGYRTKLKATPHPNADNRPPD